METQLLKIGLRQNAVYLPHQVLAKNSATELQFSTTQLVARCAKLGFSFAEPLLQQMNALLPNQQMVLLKFLGDIKGVNKNWTPLNRDWHIAESVNWFDQLTTRFANLFNLKSGIILSCGHRISNAVFPLERYNGCPLCGMPFQFEDLILKESKHALTVLDLWVETDMQQYLTTLLQSPVALNAVQVDDLKILLKYFELPEGIEIKMKESKMLVVDALVSKQQLKAASSFLNNPNEILRYLWYKHTGKLQVVEPKVIAQKLYKNSVAHWVNGTQIKTPLSKAKASLKLKFSRSECKMYATWLNQIKLPVAKQCELMHPKRGIWVRVIRALRLTEYSKKKGFEQLAKLLDAFYNKNYQVWNGAVQKSRMQYDADTTFDLLKQKPGAFARSLFANMLWYGEETTVQHFKQIANEVPLRLLLSLNMYAPLYFDKTGKRIVKTPSGLSKRIPKNQLVQLFEKQALDKAKIAVKDLTLDAIAKNYSGKKTEANTIFIDEQLFNIPLAIGDRVEQLQDINPTLMGTTFKVKGDKVRLFMNWGKGMKAQHLDMDLSCSIAYENRIDRCSYQKLITSGCKHSGDIQRIPNKVGTAEYIDIDLSVLAKKQAQYVCFTCNAYTSGSLNANMVVGWMNSEFPMKVSKSGVAYNPTAVQHQIRITEGLTKGLLFGVLDVSEKQIIWMELPFGGQVVQNLDLESVETMLERLKAKIKIGELLQLKAKAQQLELVKDANLADEVYDMKWAGNTAAVSELLLAE